MSGEDARSSSKFESSIRKQNRKVVLKVPSVHPWFILINQPHAPDFLTFCLCPCPPQLVLRHRRTYGCLDGR